MAFSGAINYGIGGALYEISTLDYLKRMHSYQIMYSFFPGVLSFAAIQNLLMSPEITIGLMLGTFGFLSVLQIISFVLDRRLLMREQLPKWYMRVRIPSFITTLLITALIFSAMFSKTDIINNKQPGRIDTLKRVMELDDVDFLTKVNELGLQYDLKEIEEKSENF